MIDVVYAASWLSGRRFYLFSHHLYRNDPCWREPAVWGGQKMLNPMSNVLLRYPHAMLFAIENNRILARVLTGTRGDGQGYFALFDAEDRSDAVRKLMDEAVRWQKKHGSKEIIGPIAPIIADLGGGVLTDGFGTTAAFNDSYNADYYDRLLKDSGFVRNEEWLSYRINLIGLDRGKYRKTAEWCCERFDYSTADGLDFSSRELAEIMYCVMDGDINMEQADRLARKIGRFLTGGLCPVVYAADEPVGMLLTVRNRQERPRVATLWVREKWRRKGVTSVLFGEFLREADRLGLSEIDGSTIGSDNLPSILGAERAGGRVVQRFSRYRMQI
ncbi:MAG: GNAT family N-acetyltransferase [Clostridia bacterium]|nr:GNAT family N-acetyltransferase [Clostridia bacterium]